MLKLCNYETFMKQYHNVFSLACYLTTIIIHLTAYSKTKLVILDNVKIGNLKRKNRDHKKVPKQDEDTGNLQILLHLRSLF